MYSSPSSFFSLLSASRRSLSNLRSFIVCCLFFITINSTRCDGNVSADKTVWQNSECCEFSGIVFRLCNRYIFITFNHRHLHSISNRLQFHLKFSVATNKLIKFHEKRHTYLFWNKLNERNQHLLMLTLLLLLNWCSNVAIHLYTHSRSKPQSVISLDLHRQSMEIYKLKWNYFILHLTLIHQSVILSRDRLLFGLCTYLCVCRLQCDKSHWRLDWFFHSPVCSPSLSRSRYSFFFCIQFAITCLFVPFALSWALENINKIIENFHR